MFRSVVLLLIALLLAVPVSAQNSSPDYAIRNIRSRFVETNQQAQVQFEVWNIGGSAAVTSTAILTVISTGQQVATDVVPPLQSQEIVTVTLTFPVSMFPPNSVQSFRAEVGVGEVEAPSSANVQSNYAQITVTFPETQSQLSQTPTTPLTTPAVKKDILAEFLGSLGITVDLNDRTQVAVLAGIVGAFVILLLLIVEIIRLLFQRPPDFGNWQPPYANMPFIDPNSQAGRRQQWQLYAQNSSLPGGSAEGALHARKLPIGSDGRPFSGWHVTAMRICHYDQYGRVSRSQVIASKGVSNRVNRVIRGRAKLSPEKMARLLRPAATGLVKPFRKKLNERNVMLPLALDVRLEGKYGEARILFELYQCQYRRWRLIDRWEPDMAVIGKKIRESATYTLYGMRAGETLKSFRQRLVDDLTQTLVELVAPAMGDEEQDSKPTNPHLERTVAK
jgi:hypothetical protein